MGCGRTDAGVHGKNFYMHMDFPEIGDIGNFIFKLNHMLPDDIVIHNIYEVSADKHVRFDAVERTYYYNLHTVKDPFIMDESHYYYDQFDLQKANKAASVLLKHTDFEAFSKVKTAVKTFNCNVMEAKWIESKYGYQFIITADRFLRNMVRAVVGTLLEVGKGKISIEEFEQIILDKNRQNAGISVPAKGLSLVNVRYPYTLDTNLE